MDLVLINQILSNNFFVSLAVGYVAEKLGDGVLKYVKRKFDTDSIERQFIEMLDDAMRKTWETVFKEYDPTALSLFVTYFANIEHFDMISSHEKALEKASGRTVTDELVSIWIKNIGVEIAKPGREWLYRYVSFQGTIKDNRIKTANNDYAKSFREAMFLHKNSDRIICLSDLYVIPTIKTVNTGCDTDLNAINILEYLRDFTISRMSLTSKKEINGCLFIEGNAGTGKSSLVSYLAHIYQNKWIEWADIFGERELICIGLREIIPTTLRFTRDSINADILHYLNMDSLEQFNERHKRSVVILDGFDELCTVKRIYENVHYYIKELTKLFRECILIITSRPQYMRIQEIDIYKSHIALQHFDKTQREKWVKMYRETGCDEQEVDTLDYIESLDNNEICDTPMILYMMTSGRIDEDAKKNNWALCNQIFFKELSETEYNSVFPAKYGTYSHAVKIYNDSLYRISAEIAYVMYKNHNTKLFLNENELKEIINNMGISDLDIKEAVKSCYALCAYWNVGTEKGAIEFYHNIIRDFFMCEKIFYEMNEIYNDFKNLSGVYLVEVMVERLSTLFIYDEINDEVIEFLYLRILYQKDKSYVSNFAKNEQRDRLLIYSFRLLASGYYINGHDTFFKDAYKSLFTILKNTVKICRYSYEPYLNKRNDRIIWFDKNNNDKLFPFTQIYFKDLFMDIRLLINKKFIYATSKSAFFSVNFYQTSLEEGSFSLCYFNECTFSEIRLRSSGFEETDFNHSLFLCADLRHAIFKKCTLTNCAFIDADLRYADFTDCIIVNCTFEEVDLSNATLKDGFSSPNSNEVKQHLLELLRAEPPLEQM